MSRISVNFSLRKLVPWFMPKKRNMLNVYCVLDNGSLELLETIIGESPNDCMKRAIEVFGRGRTDLVWKLPIEEVR